MAAGPQKAKKIAKLTDAEKIIDRLVKESDNTEQVTVDVKLLPTGLQPADYAELSKRYKAAGWRIAAYVGDQRDGSYFNLQV